MPALTTGHILTGPRGMAWVGRTNPKAIEVATDMVAHGWSPGETHFQHPDRSLAQTHGAPGYYHDHKAGIDGHIGSGLRESSRKQATSGNCIPDLHLLCQAGVRKDFSKRVGHLPL